MKPTLIHCSYHKCLTVYFSNIFGKMLNKILHKKRGYKHFNSLIEGFYSEQDQYAIASVNNQSIDLSRYKDYRITRIIRDPRDMIISGYFYHKRGAEHWCNVTSPVSEDWKVVNGNIPERMLGTTHSYSSYLESISFEQGLLAEIEFRKNHYQSMLEWPLDDTNIKLFKYEDILGHEVDVIKEMLSFFEFPFYQKILGVYLANKNSVANRKISKSSHVRDPSAGQWRGHFTPMVESSFNAQYGELINKYEYK